MAYRVPARDVRFVFKELAGLDEVLSLPGFEDVSADLIDAVLEENARFVEQVVAPLNRRGDTDPARWNNGAVVTTPGFREAFRQYANGGWQGLQHDPRWGGQGLPKMVAAAADESINAASLAFSLCPLLTDGVVEALAAVGSPAQRDRYIPALIEGRWTGTMNLTEPQAGSDLALVATRAARQPDGTYRLSGQKIFITYGEHDLAENIIHLVLARMPDAPPGVKGISLFIVPKFLVDDDGSLGARNDVWCASLEHKLGIHASPTAVLLYGGGKGQVGGDGAVGYLVGEAHHGLEYMFVMMNAARYAVGIQGIAVSERALQKAQAYAHERVQGEALGGSAGSVAIINHPDVQRMLLTMRALTEGARALAYVAAAELDRAHRHADPAARERSRRRHDYLVPVIKGFSTEVAVEVASLGIQVHGGAGYIEETGAAQYFRDARILPIYEGTTAIQANDFVGRKTLRDAAAVARDLMAAMHATAAELAAAHGDDHAAGLDLIGRQLRAAVDAYERATEFMLARAANNTRAVLFGSVPYLMLAGVALAGWQMARAALVCVRRLQVEEGDPFLRRKFATSVFYAAHVLPRTQALAAAIVEGD
ncbi:MAG: acyl-CoA dehydrogenase, partial [Candidimonas sp.]